ncbi:MAG: hypothetical protein EA397_09400 [Deltaproteobacteria bacterium]|nr:MAG: hypothetical protein EA397_09400 [Deltaproteobacteria bacterium]
MALKPTSEQHAAQIAAGISGRNRGHKFEKALTSEINEMVLDHVAPPPIDHPHLMTGDPAALLVGFVKREEGFADGTTVEAYWLGGLATSGEGDELRDSSGNLVTGSKSDVLLRFTLPDGSEEWRGVSVKTCFNATPTNAQLYCSTAVAFCGLLRSRGLTVTADQEVALRRFCGDPGYRPQDTGDDVGRSSTPERWFWEELAEEARNDWERLFTEHHRDVLLALLKYAYEGDAFPPDYLLHLRHKGDPAPVALYTMDQIADLSVAYGSFSTRNYKVHKGRYKSDPHQHQAPRFGIVQFQPLGNKQNRNQLQFNLQARYFDKVPYEVEEDLADGNAAQGPSSATASEASGS